MDFSKPKILIDLDEYNHLKESYKKVDEELLFDLRLKHTIEVLKAIKSTWDTEVKHIHKQSEIDRGMSLDTMNRLKILAEDKSSIDRIIEEVKKTLDEK